MKFLHLYLRLENEVKSTERDTASAHCSPPPVEGQKHSWEGRGAVTTIPGTLMKQETFFYTLSLPISTAIIGCDSVEQVEEYVELARSFNPLNQTQMAALEAKVEPVAKQPPFFRLMPR
jgi:aryl-alcohol dehydrogenase-like predicted oxidoreductase